MGRFFQVTVCFNVFIVFLICASLPAQAFNGVSSCTRVGWFQEGGTCSKDSGDHCNQKGQTYNAEEAEEFTVQHYVREGHKIRNFKHEYNQQGNQYTARLNAICGGTTTGGGALGEWAIESYTGVCWGRHELLSTPNCANERLGRTHDQLEPRVISSRIDRCAAGCCSIEENTGDGSHAITGATGDPMMAMYDETEAFHEYRANGCDEVNWLDRKGKPGVDLPLMLPSGCAEYKSFVQGKFGGAVDAEAVCRSANLSICPRRPTPPAMPEHRGCGTSSGAYGSSYSTGSSIRYGWEIPHNGNKCYREQSCTDRWCVVRSHQEEVCENVQVDICHVYYRDPETNDITGCAEPDVEIERQCHMETIIDNPCERHSQTLTYCTQRRHCNCGASWDTVDGNPCRDEW